MMKVMCDTEQEYYLQQMVHQKLHGCNLPEPRCTAATLMELATQLRHMTEQLYSGGSPLYHDHHLTRATSRLYCIYWQGHNGCSFTLRKFHANFPLSSIGEISHKWIKEIFNGGTAV